MDTNTYVGSLYTFECSFENEIVNFRKITQIQGFTLTLCQDGIFYQMVYTLILPPRSVLINALTHAPGAKTLKWEKSSPQKCIEKIMKYTLIDCMTSTACS